MFSDKNKITQTTALSLEWNDQSLLELVNARLRARLGEGRRVVEGDHSISDERLSTKMETHFE